MTPGKLIGWIVGAAFALAGPALLFGAGVAWENRPANWPNVQVGPCPFCVHLGFGESPGARLAALQAAEAAAATRAIQVAQAQAQISTAAGAAETAAQTRIRVVTRTLIREIPDVLTPQVDGRFALPVGFVRLHDAAAAGLDLSAVPDPAGRPDDAASDVKPSAAAAAIADNYGACHADDEQLQALQRWVIQEARAQRAGAAPR